MRNSIKSMFFASVFSVKAHPQLERAGRIGKKNKKKKRLFLSSPQHCSPSTRFVRYKNQ